MNLFRFQDPWMFLLLLPLALLIWYRYKRQPKSALVFSTTVLLKDIPRTWAARVKPILPILVYAGLVLMIIALARPQRGREGFRVRSDGIGIVMCLDRSGSMQAMDFFLDQKRVDRLEVVKKVFREFVLGTRDFSGRPDDLIGLVAFGGYVDSYCPLTLDHESLADMLSTIQCPTPLLDKNGQVIRTNVLEEEAATAIGDALMTSIDRIKGSKTKSKVIVLLSDGVQNTGVVTAEEAAAIAKDFGIKVYTIGIGTSDPVPFPVYGPNGEKGYTRQMLELDSTTLKNIAETTGGKYYHVDETNALRKVCEEIDTLEKTTNEDRVFTKYFELYRWFLASGLALVLLGLVPALSRFRSVP